MSQPVDIKEFAIRVERLCDFFIAKHVMAHSRDGSEDLRILEDLKEDAANIQFSKEITIDGLKDFMNGASIVDE